MIHIPTLLARFVGEDFFQNRLREVEEEHASNIARIRTAVLNKARQMYPDVDQAKLLRIIISAQSEMLAPFEESYREYCRTLRAAIAACKCG